MFRHIDHIWEIGLKDTTIICLMRVGVQGIPEKSDMSQDWLLSNSDEEKLFIFVHLYLA